MERDVYEKYYPKIFNYIYYRVLNRADTEDICSDVFTKAVAKGSTYNPKSAAYSTWLYTIARNCVTDFYRRKKTTLPEEALASLPDTSEPAEDGVVRKEEYEHLHTLLATLPEAQRHVLALRFWGELPNREIAALLGMSQSNVSTLINRAVSKLRALL